MAEVVPGLPRVAAGRADVSPPASPPAAAWPTDAPEMTSPAAQVTWGPLEEYTNKTTLMLLLERGDEKTALQLLGKTSPNAPELGLLDRWESSALHYASM